MSLVDDATLVVEQLHLNVGICRHLGKYSLLGRVEAGLQGVLLPHIVGLVPLHVQGNQGVGQVVGLEGHHHTCRAEQGSGLQQSC